MELDDNQKLVQWELTWWQPNGKSHSELYYMEECAQEMIDNLKQFGYETRLRKVKI